MEYSQPDGFPITFSLNDAARITDISVPRLRNYIARDILKHVGQVPLAGSERRFSVSGLVEIALLSQLGTDFGLESAKLITHKIIQTAYTMAYLNYCYQHPESEWATQVSPNGRTAEINGHMDSHPDDWLHLHPWDKRDRRQPALLVFAMDSMSIVGPEVARGFEDVAAARERMLVKFAESHTILGAGDKVSDLQLDEISDSWSLIHILNLTSVLNALDAGIQEVLANR